MDTVALHMGTVPLTVAGLHSCNCNLPSTESPVQKEYAVLFPASLMAPVAEREQNASSGRPTRTVAYSAVAAVVVEKLQESE
jgi:hypothetical protein